MYVGIDVGGTNVKIASFTDIVNPELLEFKKFDINNDYKLDIKNILHSIEKIATEDLKGVGIGVPGTLTEAKREILICPNLMDWNGKKITSDLESVLGCRVRAENDTTLASLGEAEYGIGKDQDFIFLIWGTGVGGAEIKHLNNKLYVFSFEPGHQYVKGEEELEYLVGGAGIYRRFGKSPADLTEPEWSEILPVLSVGVVNMLLIRPTKLIIFGGGIALNKPEKVDRLHAMLKDKLKMFPVPKFKISRLGEKAALFGSLTLFG
ncbi:hypothetical protein A2961_00345 [Candidatus Woesebacteria bacterium RIFCSPLOWO2_01_FULL_39_21]|uniref:ROK family protein n=1 Tax=Candidatus Woesebacteria bacterium RIFCSPLOWO2_01_FULL_39_21 TaxID=1802519 RepID=A0A1F8BI39_9BACT|nr:MAG: hypothetical protein A2691_03815 [Candidatus Woesebacteria bacterium RIFCSPHIGHO2_01_FULL_39_23]OGM63630.1 MAG: hypothetical protein A2961_00345 [Candidatus Woesebacteria bacterium RIFCSPLOWO2_01_FULL_39_21]